MLDERFWSKVDKGSACWNWLAGKNADGYGKFSLGGRIGGMKLAHRLAYEEVRGSIPDGQVIDHLCRNRACVNPEHLEVVHRGVNVLRGEGTSARHARKTTCPKGHPYDRKYGRRRACLTCKRDHLWDRRARKG